MPTYVYRCPKCKHVFELFHSITDENVRRCPRCRARAARVPAGGAGILFKGSGFYLTDYRSRAYREKAKQETSGGAPETAGAAGSGSPGAPTGGDGAGSSAGPGDRSGSRSRASSRAGGGGQRPGGGTGRSGEA